MKECPNCKKELEPKNIGSVEVEECKSCKGTWFDKGELKEAKDQKDPDLNWMDFEIWKHEDQFSAAGSDRSCPICNVPMFKVAYGTTGVAVDFCKKCNGTWLEKNEFQKIVKSLELELSSKTFTDYIKEAVREGLEIVSGPESLASEWKDFSTVLRMMQYRLLVEHSALQKAITSVQSSAQ